MTPEERALIDGLFERMRSVEGQPRDAEAETLIAQHVAAAPHATYALAQTVLVQEHALQQAYARVQELEAEVEAAYEAAQAPQQSGGFLGGLFGGGRSSVPSAGARAQSAMPSRGMPNTGGAPMGVPSGYAQQQGGYPPGYGQAPGCGQASGPWGAQQAQPQRGGFGGGGFLQGALTTAAGVAGGALLYDGIKNMMGGGTGPIAQQAAAELPASSSGGFGNLGSDAQAALGGNAGGMPMTDQPMDSAAAGGAPGQDGFWTDDPQLASYDGGYDDGGDWDMGGDDDSWA